MSLKIILTGATGFVGEGVLLECLANPKVEQVLMVNRKSYDFTHPKLKECLVPDFMKLDGIKEDLRDYDACFYCAGISSVGMKEAEYTHITYDLTINFANVVKEVTPKIQFNFISGGHTDSSEKGKIMWARVKGKTENALGKMGFMRAYNFRPGYMHPTAGQKNVKSLFRFLSVLYPLLKLIFPNNVITMEELGKAMINSCSVNYDKQTLEAKDIKKLAAVV